MLRHAKQCRTNIQAATDAASVSHAHTSKMQPARHALCGTHQAASAPPDKLMLYVCVAVVWSLNPACYLLQRMHISGG